MKMEELVGQLVQALKEGANNLSDDQEKANHVDTVLKQIREQVLAQSSRQGDSHDKEEEPEEETTGTSCICREGRVRRHNYHQQWQVALQDGQLSRCSVDS